MKIDNNNKTLLDLWTKCVGEPTVSSQETKQQEVNVDKHTAKCQVSNGNKYKKSFVRNHDIPKNLLYRSIFYFLHDKPGPARLAEIPVSRYQDLS